MLTFSSTYVNKLLAPRIKEVDAKIQRIHNYVVAYNAQRCQCEFEYDTFIHVNLWKDILERHCDRTHSQYGIVAIIRAEAELKKKLLSASDQCAGLTGEEFLKSGKLFLQMSKYTKPKKKFDKQVSSVKSFSVGSLLKAPAKKKIKLATFL